MFRFLYSTKITPKKETKDETTLIQNLKNEQKYLKRYSFKVYPYVELEVFFQPYQTLWGETSPCFISILFVIFRYYVLYFDHRIKLG